MGLGRFVARIGPAAQGGEMCTLGCYGGERRSRRRIWWILASNTYKKGLARSKNA